MRQSNVTGYGLAHTSWTTVAWPAHPSSLLGRSRSRQWLARSRRPGWWAARHRLPRASTESDTARRPVITPPTPADCPSRERSGAPGSEPGAGASLGGRLARGGVDEDESGLGSGPHQRVDVRLHLPDALTEEVLDLVDVRVQGKGTTRHRSAGSARGRYRLGAAGSPEPDSVPALSSCTLLSGRLDDAGGPQQAERPQGRPFLSRERDALRRSGGHVSHGLARHPLAPAGAANAPPALGR